MNGEYIHMLAKIYAFGRRNPKLKMVIGPIWRMGREALWELRQLFWSGKNITVNVNGNSIAMAPVGQIAKRVWGGGFEDEERDFISKVLRPGMRVLNIGANSGLYTVIASKLVGENGEVHSFEPSTQNFEWLKKNVEINGCSNVFLNNFAVSNFEGKLELKCDPDHPNYDGHFYVSSVSAHDAVREDAIEIIPCMPLDSYCEKFRRCQPFDFMIIDVEGAELSVFQGAHQTLSNSPNLVMVLECTQNESEMERFLAELGFGFFKWNPYKSKLLPRKLEMGSFIAMRSDNMLLDGNYGD